MRTPGLWLPVNDPFLHDEAHASQRTDVASRVAFDGNQICEQAGTHRSDAIVEVKHARIDGRRRP